MNRPWISPGPVATAFLETEAEMAILMGPVAGGKTITGLQKGIVASWLWPESSPGLRRVKFGITRRLWKDLEATTMKSWFEWFPKSMGTWIGDPPTHFLTLPHPTGGTIEMMVEFKAFGEQRIEEGLRGWEISYGYCDEIDLSPDNTLTFLRQRAARYPSGMLDKAPKQAWGTCNAPEEDNWVVRDLIDQPQPYYRLFRQPSGLAANAENLNILGAQYYRELADSMPPFERRRFVENIPGLSRNGDAVYPEFNPDLHIAAKPLEVLDRPVIIGLDAGGTPAAGLWQRKLNGQWRKFGEISTHAKEHGSITGPNRFGELLAEVLAERARGLRVHALADPSAAYGADTANGESSWIDTVARVCKIPVRSAPGNNSASIRTEALRLPMGKLIDGREPALLLCPSCKLTARAYARDYQHRVTAGRRTGVLDNWATHLVDADQYALLDGGAYHEVTARGDRRREDFKPVVAGLDFNPFGG